MAYANDCRSLITRAWRREKDERGEFESFSPNPLHTALNIALFPPLFFFSGLFYTDVLSTCAVLRMYRLFLQRTGSGWLYLAGILALTMRQTNIFWVAVFMGGMEAVRAIKSVEKVSIERTSDPQTPKETILSEFYYYVRGEIHDIPLKEAGAQGMLSTFYRTVSLLSTPRLHTLRYQHRDRNPLSPDSHHSKAVAIPRTHYLLRRLRLLERRCRSRYVILLYISLSITC